MKNEFISQVYLSDIFNLNVLMVLASAAHILNVLMGDETQYEGIQNCLVKFKVRERGEKK